MTGDQSGRGDGFSGASILAVAAAVGGVALLVWAGVHLATTTRVDRAVPAVSTSVVTTRSSPPTTSSSPTTAARPPLDVSGFVTISDDSGWFSVAVPDSWSDVSGTGWVVDGQQVGPGITAASDIDAWYSSWGTPGVFVGVSTTGYVPESGDFSSVCSSGASLERSGGALIGTVQAWHSCGREGGDFYVFLGEPADGSFAILVQLVAVDGSGSEMLDALLNTFSVQP